MAKALGEPVAVVSTSGTAAVNFAPAVVEAYYAHVPLLLLTADRPPELRDVGANQTIDQPRLYGPHVRWFTEVLLPETSEEAIRYIRTLAGRATATARSNPPGPVHLNFPFREPLVPSGGGPPPVDRGGAAYVSIAQAPRRPSSAELAPLARELRGARRVLIVCGPQDDAGFPGAVVRLAQDLEAPLLADPLSQVRCGPHHSPLIIDSYDAFLRDEETVQALIPQMVLRFGPAPTSKPLLLYLQRHANCRQILIDEGRWHDPALVASDVLHSHPGSFCEALLGALQPTGRQTAPGEPSEWVCRWTQTAQQARSALQHHLGAEPALSEPRVFAELAELLPARATLFVGSSMPVRDLDTFFPGGERPIRFLANRGASGIDGVVSAALGASAGTDGPLVLVIGDLSFYHDMNGLLAARRHALRATIVLLNNDGGGIFSFLPQADDPEHFEELFGTPHGLDFRPVTEMYGLAYRPVRSWAELRTAVRESVASPGVTLVEVPTDRPANVRLHRQLWEVAARAIRGSPQEEAAP
jgi:2-succinyl-5-enolpyruvyl-6-hydroxy-3-cyclohexene-1-carboxylate synthase